MTDRPRRWESRGSMVQGEPERRRFDAAIAAGADADASPSTLAVKRQKAARVYALKMLRGLAASPAFKTGQRLETSEVRAIVSDWIESEQQLPASLKDGVRETGTRIIELVASGARQDADDRARAEAFTLADRLAKSTWNPDAVDDGFDPHAVADRIRRS